MIEMPSMNYLKDSAGKFLAILMRYVGNREESEDILQEGFLKYLLL